MSSIHTKTKYQFADVMPIAIAVRNTLAVACDRIEIAGSLRRGKRAVSDIEIVAIPTMDRIGIFEDQEESRLDGLLNALACEFKITKIMGGKKAKRYMINTSKPPIQLDLFIANKVRWGLIMAIRTGPAEYSKHIVTQRHKCGGLDGTYRVKEGYLWRCPTIDEHRYKPPNGINSKDAAKHFDGKFYVMVDTPEEEDFFKYIAGGYVQPKLRGMR